MQIVPSILENNIEDFLTTLKKLSPYFSYFQIDIADGLFVPNKTVQIEELIKYVACNMKHVTFDFHLMVKDYEPEIKKLEKLLARRSLGEDGRNLIKIKNILIHHPYFPNYQLPITNYFNLGLVLNPQDSIETITQKYDLKKIPVIQIMSVNPGFQQQPFIRKTLKKIEQLRLTGYRSKIFLDGGINEKTLPIILEQKFKPDVLCIGSFLTKTENIEERVKYLQKMC